MTPFYIANTSGHKAQEGLNEEIKLQSIGDEKK